MYYVNNGLSRRSIDKKLQLPKASPIMEHVCYRHSGLSYQTKALCDNEELWFYESMNTNSKFKIILDP